MIAAVAGGSILGLAFLITACADEEGAKLHIGVYDNRAIAVAYRASEYNPVGSKMKEYEKARLNILYEEKIK